MKATVQEHRQPNSPKRACTDARSHFLHAAGGPDIQAHNRLGGIIAAGVARTGRAVEHLLSC